MTDSAGDWKKVVKKKKTLLLSKWLFTFGVLSNTKHFVRLTAAHLKRNLNHYQTVASEAT